MDNLTQGPGTRAATLWKNIAVGIPRYRNCSTVTGLAATVLLSGKIFMVGARYTAGKLYRGIDTVYRSTETALPGTNGLR